MPSLRVQLLRGAYFHHHNLGNMEHINGLPKYMNTKVLGAAKVKEVRYLEIPTFTRPVCRSIVGCGRCDKCTWLRQNNGLWQVVQLTLEVPTDLPSPRQVEVSREWVTNRQVEVGGYYIEYADGIKSYRSAKDFEKDYQLC